ncbi:hypothetical protein FOA52_004360 [Chlamydomonas sp. UWO 241]|nr:hypothetical protein FOA52_004360 [Chlamydomonas sp. UWO 241]
MPELQDTVLEYMDAIAALGHRLMSAVSISLGHPPDFFRDAFLSPEPLLLFRIFNYPAQQQQAEEKGERWGVAEHTDYGVLTILKQDDSGGLQVKNRKNEWIEAPPVPGSFVINIGDMLEKMTSGLYRSTPHRVRLTRGPRDRLSFPFFFDPSFTATVAPVPLPVGMAQGVQRSDDGYLRWDGASVDDFTGTYGEYLTAKVSRVFPELAKGGIGGYKAA